MATVFLSDKALKHSYYFILLNNAKQKWTYVLNKINQCSDDYNQDRFKAGKYAYQCHAKKTMNENPLICIHKMSIKTRKEKTRSELSAESLTLMNACKSERRICAGTWRHHKRVAGSRPSSGSEGSELFLFSGVCNFCPCQLMKGLILSHHPQPSHCQPPL